VIGAAGSDPQPVAATTASASLIVIMGEASAQRAKAR
jgi:hypothetical protein